MIMKHIFKYLMLGAVALLTHACNNESESDLLEPKVYFENKTQMLSIEGETMNVELSARLTTMSCPSQKLGLSELPAVLAQ